MIPYSERIRQIKSEQEGALQNRMIFLLNPKDTKILEALVAWSAMPKKDFSEVVVDENATLAELWNLADCDMMGYATMLGVAIKESVQRFSQLRGLGIIYPDGSMAELANTIVNKYIKGQVKTLLARSKDDE